MVFKAGLALLGLFAGSLLSPEEELLVRGILDSGRCGNLADTPDSRVTPRASISPGAPPILSFRYYEGKLHHRFGNAELMLDDAGH
ncbi:MAG: hypothetical protein ACJ746_17225 [Bryobacteraceae bacterium]